MQHELLLTRRLFELADAKYADFMAKLVPTVERERIIGVRLPALRKLAKSAAGTPEALEYLRSLPHRYFDENNLHAMLLKHEGDIERLLASVEALLPYVDNWATCDMLPSPLFAKHPELVFTQVKKWFCSSHTFTVRFAAVTLLCYYLGENYLPEQSDLCARLVSSEYYINMALAWYFAEGLARRPADFIPYFEYGKIKNPWVHKKALQKARESRRVPRDLLCRLAELKTEK